MPETAFFITFVLACCTSPIILPLIIGLIILTRYWGDELSRMIGLFVLKPVVSYPLWFIIGIETGQATSLQPNDDPVQVMVGLLPDILLTLVIVLVFRKLFTKNNLSSWFFLALDCIRWGNTFIMGIVGKEKEMSFLVFGWVFPSVFAVIGLLVVFLRSKSLIKTEQEILE